ncbi:MAG: oxalate:formate antiporter [Thermodesulfobacteria bacterium]|nr:oxalate:formate antiporter [Thermodesulfobacteriota bacterium]
MTQRSCVYFGARYVLGPVKEAIHLVHGGVGCSYYGKMVRGRPAQVFSTDFSEYDVIFGGISKLKTALTQAFSLNPKAKGAFVYVTCVSSIIGEDVESIAHEVSKKLGKEVKIVACPGFSAISQSKGHAIAYQVLSKIIKPYKPYDFPAVNLIGDYNVGGETKVIKNLLSKIGIKVHTVLTGDTKWSEVESLTKARLNLLLCSSTAKDFCETVKNEWGIPYIKVSFYGITAIKESLLKIAEFFNIPQRKVSAILKEEERAVYEEVKGLLPGLKGKKAMIILGAARIFTLSAMLKDLGLEVELGASIFAKEVDHEEAKPIVKHLTDNPGDDELERVFSLIKPDVVFINTRHQWQPVKLGIPVISFPQPSERGPYAGYTGMINFAKQLYSVINAPVWRLLSESF